MLNDQSTSTPNSNIKSTYFYFILERWNFNNKRKTPMDFSFVVVLGLSIGF